MAYEIPPLPRESYARPNPPPEPPPEPVIGVSPEFGGAGTGRAFEGGGSAGLSGAIDDRLAARIAARDAPPAAAPAAPAAPAAARPAPVIGSAYQATVESAPAAPADDTRSVQVPQRVIGASSGGYDPTQTQAALDSANARSRVFNAVAEQDARNAATNGMAYNDRAVASYDAGIAKREAQVARFKAENSADTVLGDLGSRIVAKKGLNAAADAAEGRAEAARVRAGTSINPVGNIAADTIAAQDVASRAQIANQAGAESASRTALNQQHGVITAAQQRAQLERDQRINTLGATLQNAKVGSPEYAKASQALLSILGKDKPDQYKLHVVNRPDRLAPDGFTVLKGGQDIVMVGPDGKTEVVPIGAQGQGQKGGGAAPPQSLADYIAKMRADPRNAKFSDAELTSEYSKKYGGGR